MVHKWHQDRPRPQLFGGMVHNAVYKFFHCLQVIVYMKWFLVSVFTGLRCVQMSVFLCLHMSLLFLLWFSFSVLCFVHFGLVFGWTQWHETVVPATWKPAVRGPLEARSLSSVWTTEQDYLKGNHQPFLRFQCGLQTSIWAQIWSYQKGVETPFNPSTWSQWDRLGAQLDFCLLLRVLNGCLRAVIRDSLYPAKARPSWYKACSVSGSMHSQHL